MKKESIWQEKTSMAFSDHFFYISTYNFEKFHNNIDEFVGWFLIFSHISVASKYKYTHNPFNLKYTNKCLRKASN